MNMQTQVIEVITPALALKYLEMMQPNHESDNRKVRQSHVDGFADLMRAGRFHLTSQGISFHEDGWLGDGQHRLWAIVETGIAQKMWVARGLTTKEILSLDQGLVRTIADVAHYDGVAVDPICWPVAKILVRTITMASFKVPYEVVKEWYEFYQDGVDFAVMVRGLCQPMKRKLTAPMAAAVARAYYGVEDEAVLLRFFEIVNSGQRNSDSDAAATVFRDVWMTGRMSGRKEEYFKTCAAIRAFVDRRKIKTLQSAEIEVWNLPKLPKDLLFKTISGKNSPRSGAVVRAKARERAAAGAP